MENLSRSVSKKVYNGNGFATQTVYDDVFGGPPKFGIPTLSPRVEDYTEIFGSFRTSRASSIPILDLPAVDEADFSFDVRCSQFDYTEVFGGFNGLDFAVSFDELFNQSKTAYDSSEEAWTPAQSKSLSDVSDPSVCSERNPSLSNEEFYQSCNIIKQFNVSYNEVSQRSKEDMSNGMAHATQLHDVPGFTFIVNEGPSQKIEDRNTSLQETEDLIPNVDFRGGLREGKQFRKTMSHPSNSSFGIQTLGTDLKPVDSGKSASMNEALLTVSDISLRTQPSRLPPPSRPPPVLAVKDGDSDRQKSKLKASQSFSFGETAGDSSPLFFDVEVDASSSAAVSTAAMKDAMEKAQAKLKSAKELMERKEGLQSCTKLDLKNDAKDRKGKESKIFDGSSYYKDERVHGACQSDCYGMKTFAMEERQKVMKTAQVVSDSIEGSRKIFEQAMDERVLVQNTQFREHRREKEATTASQPQEDDNMKIKDDRKAREWDGNKGGLIATKESNMQEEHEKKVKVNQEVCKQEENRMKTRMAQQHEDIEKIQTEAEKSKECENLPEVQQKEDEVEVEKKLKVATERIEDEKRHKDAHEREENERRLKETLERERYEKRLKEAIKRAEIEKRLKEALDQEEKEKQQREACEREKKQKRQKEACQREENEKRLKEAFEQEENKKRLREALEREETEKRQKEENEKRLKEALKQEENKKRLKEALEREETEKRHKEAREREEKEKRQKEACEREENEKRLKEAFEQEENKKRLKEALQREETEKRQKEENEKRLKEALEQEENKKRLKEALEREETEKRHKEAREREEKEKRQKEAREREDSDKRLKEAREREENEKRLKEAFEQEENKKRLKEAREREEKEKRQKEAREREDSEKRLKEAREREENEKRLREALEQEENKKRLKEALEQEEKEKRQKEAREIEDSEKILKESREREENEKRLKEALEQEEDKKRLKEALEREETERRQKEENEKRLKGALEQEENKKRLKEALEREETEKRLKMVLDQEENEIKQKLARERDENEKRLVENLRPEEIEKKLSCALQQEENAKRQKEDRGENEERLNEACERKDKEKRLKEALEQEVNKKRLQEAHEREESEKRPKEAFKHKEIEKISEDANDPEKTQKRIEDAGYWEELKGCSKDHEQNEKDENERKLKSDQVTFVRTKENFKASDEACSMDDYESLQADKAACRQDKNSVKMKKTEGALSFEEDGNMKAESIDSEGQVEAVEVVSMPFEEQSISSDMAQDDPQHEKNPTRMKDATASIHLHDTVKESVEAGIGIGQTHMARNKKTSEIPSNPGKPNVIAYELGERGNNVKEAQVTFHKEESKAKFMSSQVVRELIENGRKMGADQPTVLERKRNAQSTAQKVSTSQNTERKDKNLNDILTSEEREKEERIKRERELEKDRQRKIEEEREREREREKDLMAVDRATLEARERAFTEARERAAVERATAEFRQRAMAEARERLEKACAEVRETSLAEKASMEARLRAERAAVERATLEARERAFQKAMAEKATFEARERVERSVADRSSASYKNGGMRQSSLFSDVRYQGIGPSIGSIYSYSSVHGGVEGESAQRCKARLERHRRTAERAAKALAEKNMRDLLAQREQAERNRLSEALDAEVKRWSSGKEGNLRALLSTMQYILGPDSGWQPVPLTEVITSTSVKKAYRKATLCVHPDKLQQRGASIQQKYICEKVFDLLKEAWNKFNSEER